MTKINLELKKKSKTNSFKFFFPHKNSINQRFVQSLMKKRKNKNSKVKVIIFDLGGVVVFYDHMIAAKKISKLINIPAKRIFKAISGNNSKFTNAYERGKPRKVYWRLMFDSLHKNPKKIPVEKLDKIWCEIFWPNKEIIPLIKKLKKKYKIALVSNIGKLHERYLSKKYSLKKLFPVRIYSYKEKSRKPAKKIFEITLKKFKTKPSEVLFIDDKKVNINGAKKLGMKTILFKDNKQLFKQLENLGII